ncbi:MAG: hypothetical protein CR988_01155 [Treponema sp.]|nr:MAG: hypothetical protein CR988_01155 [Treponema sp.]
MLIKLLDICYFLLPVAFAVIAMALYDKDRKKIVKRKLLFVAIVSTVISMVYLVFLFSKPLDIKILFFNIFNSLFPFLFLSFFDFALRYSEIKEKIVLYQSLAIVFIGIPFVLNIFYPFTKEAYYQYNQNWYLAMYNTTTAVIMANIHLVIITVSILLLVKHRYTNYFKRIKISSTIIMVVSALCAIIFVSHTAIKYFITKPLVYSDVVMPLIFLLLATILYCQNKYYFLDVEPEEFLIKTVSEIDQGLVIINQALNIVWCNFQFVKIFGITETSLVKKRITDFVFKDKDKSFFNQKLNMDIPIKSFGIDKEGVISYISLPVNDGNNKFTGGIYSFKDISNHEAEKNKLVEEMQNLEKEINIKTSELKTLNLKLKNEMEARTALQNEIFSLLSLDSLTQLYNRRYISEKMTALLNNPKILNMAIILFDINGFKSINSSYGYKAGDDFLKQLAVRLRLLDRSQVNASRIGADDFLLIVSNYTQPIKIICDDIIKIITEPFMIAGKKVTITASVGVSRYPEDGIDVSSLMKFADMALYKAKKTKKNKIEFFHKDMQLKTEREFMLSDRLRAAIEYKDFLMYGNPQIIINENSIPILNSFDIVLKYKGSFISDFDDKELLQVAETTGIIKDIDRWMLKKMCSIYSATNDNIKQKHISATVKISAKTFYDELFVDKLSYILSSNNFPFPLLQIELSEETLMQQPEKSSAIIDEIKNAGMRVSVSEFGLKYSSLNYLKTFNVDKIKISKAFINEIGKSKKDEEIIKVLISLGKRLNLEMVAEGVSSQEQFDFLLKNGCNKMQGSFFGKPLEISAMLENLEKNNFELAL